MDEERKSHASHFSYRRISYSRSRHLYPIAGRTQGSALFSFDCDYVRSAAEGGKRTYSLFLWPPRVPAWPPPHTSGAGPAAPPDTPTTPTVIQGAGPHRFQRSLGSEPPTVAATATTTTTLSPTAASSSSTCMVGARCRPPLPPRLLPRGPSLPVGWRTARATTLS